MEAIKNFIGGWGLGGVSQEEERDYSSTSLKIVPSQQEQHKSKPGEGLMRPASNL
jgi:hypothetical protein